MNNYLYGHRRSIETFSQYGLVPPAGTDGYWEWFRKDGSKMRSGHFKHGKQTGEWTTYDKKGKVYRITVLK